MVDVCQNILANPQDLGFANDIEFKEFKAVLDGYEKVLLENRGKIGLFKVLARNAMAKLVSDTLTANKVAAKLRILQQDIQNALPDIPNINEEEIIAAKLLSSHEYIEFERMLYGDKNEALRNVSARVRKIASHMQSQNPLKIQEKIRRDITKHLEIARLKHSKAPQFRSGRLEEPLFYVNKEGKERTVTNINEAFLITNFDIWPAVEPQLKPKVTEAGVTRYQAIDVEKVHKIVEKEMEKFEGMSELDRQVLSDSMVGYYHMLNSNIMRFQAEGVYIDWNSDYVIANFHDKPGMLINGMVEAGVNPKDPDALNKAREYAKDKFIELGRVAFNDEKTFHARNPELKYMDAEKQEIYMRDRLGQMYDTMIGDLTTVGINDELAQIDNPSLKLSSVNSKMTSRVLYPEDGAAHYDFLKQMNEAIGRADANEGHGFVLFDKLMQEGVSLSKDITMISEFGTNPTLTLRRFSPPESNTKGSSNERKFVTDVFSGDDSYTLRSFMFPTAENSIIDVKPKVFKKFKKLLDEDEKQLRAGGSDLKNTFKESIKMTRQEKNFAYILGATLPKESISSILFLNNMLMDPFTVGLRLSEAQAVSITALNPLSAGFDMIASSFTYHFGDLAGQEFHEIFRSKIARASGVDPKEVTPEILSELLTKLGAGQAFQRKLDAITNLNRQADTQNGLAQWFQRGRQSKAFNLLGGRDMSDVSMMAEFNARLVSSDMIIQTLERFIKGEVENVSEYMQELRIKNNLQETDFGMLKEYFPDAFSGDTIDVTAFSKPVKSIEFDKIGVSEERFDKAYQDFYKNEWRKEKQRVQNLIESREKQQALTTDEAQQLFGGKTLKDMVEESIVPFKDFIEQFKEDHPQQVAQWKQQFANDYVRSKTFSMTSMYEEFTNQLLTKSDDAGLMAKIMKGGTARDRLVGANILHLKNFMIASTKLEVQSAKRGLKIGRFPQHVVGRITTWGATGLLAASVQGLLSGENKGLMELIDDVTDGEYTPEQQVAKSLSTMSKLVAMGMPIGSIFNSFAYTMGNAKGVEDFAYSVVFAPAVINTARDINMLNKTRRQEVTRQSGEETPRQEEARNKNYVKLLENAVRKTPYGNAVIPKLLMNYAVTPMLQNAVGITQEAYEREEARANQAYDKNVWQIFWEDTWNYKTDTKTTWSPE